MSGGGFALALTVFLACAVEAVEALTIVLAAGTTRQWRSTLQGVAAALAVLAVVIAVFGPAVRFIPLTSLRLLVGALLLIFGLQWLRKAVLRASGFKALHDESATFRRKVAVAEQAATGGRGIVGDWYAFTLSFKGVVLEGLEVVFIVVTFGANQHDLPVATLGAGAAVVLVTIVGVAVRAPLARVPENTMKFVVGVMLTSFGIFWSGEGAGMEWPHADAALLVLVPTVAVAAIAAAAILHRIKDGARANEEMVP
ncbi:COG4280 domain-containing protein [Nocardia sp. NBC_01388]|uniref:COG4280 domain-containing protein n=1 Tax=Nocardia sp. NBC_01388 TaxID=2903596 RepID=UPI00324A142B